MINLRLVPLCLGLALAAKSCHPNMREKYQATQELPQQQAGLSWWMRLGRWKV